MLDEELAHGYTLDDLDHITRTAITGSRTMAADWVDRYDAAYFAIVEHLYSANVYPAREDLVREGLRAISKTARLDLQYRGIDRQNMDNLAEGRQHRGFFMFWEGHTRHPSHEGYVVERVALRQVWSQLTYGQRRVLAARAAYGDNGLAAAALGKPRASFTVQLNQARRLVRQLWFEGETATAWARDQQARTAASGTTVQRAMAYVRRRGREGSPAKPARARSSHCKRGHQFDKYNTILARDGSRKCRTCCYNEPSRKRKGPPDGQVPPARAVRGYARTRASAKAAGRLATVVEGGQP